MFKSFDGFTDDYGRITTWPSSKRTQHRMAILDYLTGLFESGRIYSAEEVSRLLRDHADDALEATLLTELLDGDYLTRDERGLWRADSRPTGANTPVRGD
ncbi:DUF2087 domain-containing protein [Deinococcus sp. Marseille-Q6407]|uniref:DUF2087 domain-containing protein n=1 Tax=Deinococcus sp. Marseille-Q6407 TaxID=2969223 RepID=UPI0021BEAE18|nr:DUF2087 domain-containing protein [Deinococcus sp. Marseille-Q6407]